MTPRVTIGLPFHNEERFLGSAIRSMLAQTFTDFELLLVDDGSTDGSLAVARSFRDVRIVVLADGQRRHLPARLNEITRRARGRLVARMDADDLSHPDRLREELVVLERDPRCDAVGTLAALVDDRLELQRVVGNETVPSTPLDALRSGLLVHASMLARREWMLANPYDESLTRAEDRDLWCRTVETSRFQVVGRPLYVERVGAGTDRFIEGYVESHRQNRILFRRYGPAAVGLPGTARLWLASHAKALVMRGATRLGYGEQVVGRRGREPRPDERRLVAEAIAAAREPQRE